ncbi:MAG: hypothetical protein ACRDIB_11985 [Ardenticatenaceae bacterium]
MNATIAQFTRLDPQVGSIDGFPVTERRLSNLRGSFADDTAYAAALTSSDPVIYADITRYEDDYRRPEQGE